MAVVSPIQTTAQRKSTYHGPAGRRRSRIRWLRVQLIKSTPKTLYTNIGKKCAACEAVNITLMVSAIILKNSVIDSQRASPRYTIMGSAKAASQVTYVHTERWTCCKIWKYSRKLRPVTMRTKWRKNTGEACKWK